MEWKTLSEQIVELQGKLHAAELQNEEMRTDLMRLMTAIGPYSTVESAAKFATKTRQLWVDGVEKLKETNRLNDELMAIIRAVRNRYDAGLCDCPASKIGEPHLAGCLLKCVLKATKTEKRKCALGPDHVTHDATCGGCNHDPEHNPVTGRTYCERCGITL